MEEAASERERILSEANHGAERLRVRIEEEARTALDHAREEAEDARRRALADLGLAE